MNPEGGQTRPTRQSPRTRRDLIFYATPTGPLADNCTRYYERVQTQLEPTTAQTYPPHCTLTGFFHRSAAGTARAIDDVAEVLAAAGPVPYDAVSVVQLTTSTRWVGLELRSEWLIHLTERLVERHRLEPGDDALRLKDWLHLSLAYGVDDLRSHAELAEELGGWELGTSSGWEAALWERHRDGTWTRHDT